MLNKIFGFVSECEKEMEISCEIMDTQNPSWIVGEIVCG